MNTNKHNDAKMFARLAGTMLIASAFVMMRAFGSPTDGAPSATVIYKDLNLQTDAGVAALYNRIHRAAATVCEIPGADRNLGLRTRERACAIKAEARAVTDVHNGALSAYYEARMGRPSGLVASNNAR